MKIIYTFVFCICASAVLWAQSGGTGLMEWYIHDSTLIISGRGDMLDYKRGEAPWYLYSKSITRVEIDAGVTSIGDFAFFGCRALASVNIPNSVKTIGRNAFVSCHKLTSVTIPNSVTHIGDWAFSICIGLTSISIPNSVTFIGNRAFGACISLTSIFIPSSIKSIGNRSFRSCPRLTDITVDSCNTAYSSEDGILFNKDKTMIVAFPGGKNENYALPSTVTSIGESAFEGCNGLTTITIPNSVTSIGESAFDDCDALTTVTIGNSVTTIGERAFFDCDSLTTVTIGNSVKSIGNNAFSGCARLTSITVDSGNTFYSSEDGVLFNRDKTMLVAFLGGKKGRYAIPGTVTTIGDDAFCRCNGLTSVIIPNSITYIGDDAFYLCNGLTSVIIPSSIKYMSHSSFSLCKNLISITVDPDNTNYLSEDDVLFNKDKTTLVAFPCSKKGSYAIPCTVTSIGERAFYSCDSLTSVTIPNSVTTISEGVFYWCRGLTSVTIGKSVTTIGERAFGFCSGLTEVINLADTPQYIDSNMFGSVNTGSFTLRVPAASLSLYQNADVWKDFNIKAIMD